MFPTRLSVITYNLWNTQRWPQREAALRQFVDVYRPDVLCVQELRPETAAALDEALPDHRRVHDDFAGWICEGNIYWNGRLLECLEHGAEDVGIFEAHRRLFWARLKLIDRDRSIFVATVHYTHQGDERELETGRSPRLDQTQRTIAALARLVGPTEPALLAGDLNDPFLPTYALHDAGYRSCFAELGQLPPPTWPCIPTANFVVGEQAVNQTIDWIVANDRLRAVAAAAPQCFAGDVAPSDHWPVQAVYELCEDIA